MEHTEKEQWVRPEIETLEIAAETNQLEPPDIPQQS